MGVSVKDIDQAEFVKQFASFLKKSGKMKIPEWVDLVKTGKAQELAPYDPDWYYVRAAATARHMYVRQPVGVGAVRKIFGGKKRNGTIPGHWVPGSSSVARKVLQSLEGIKVIEKCEDGHGRVLSSQGRRDMDRIATQIAQKHSTTASTATHE